MRKRFAALVIGLGAIGILAPAASHATTLPGKCIQKTVGPIHVVVALNANCK